MEEKKEEVVVEQPKKKSHVGLILAIIFGSLVVIGLGVLLIFFGLRFLKSKPESPKEPTPKVEKVVYDVTDEKIVSLFDIFKTTGCDLGIEEFAQDKKIEAKDVSADMASGVAMRDGEYGVESKDVIPLDEFTERVQKYYGKDYQYEPYDGLPLFCFYTYKTSEKAFVKNETPICGCEMGPGTTQYRITKAVGEGDIIKVNIKVIFGNPTGYQPIYYYDFLRTRPIPDTLANLNIDTDYLYLSDEVYTNTDEYQFTFKEEDGHMIFVSSELVK